MSRSNPPGEANVEAPPGVLTVLKRACYDCHSHETVWPGYSGVAPASWIVAHDVREDRAGLNFSTWNRVPAGRRAGKIGKVWKDVAEGGMPSWSYLLVHPDARRSAGDRAKPGAWAASIPR